MQLGPTPKPHRLSERPAETPRSRRGRGEVSTVCCQLKGKRETKLFRLLQALRIGQARRACGSTSSTRRSSRTSGTPVSRRCRKSSDSILALTLSGLLLRSSNRGQLWQSIMATFASQAVDSTSALNLKVSSAQPVRQRVPKRCRQKQTRLHHE